MRNDQSVETSARDISLTPDLYLIFGFLGSGKTTLIRNMFSWEWDLSGTAVLVNEFGKVGLDGIILEGGPVPVVELTNGCICCSMRADLPIAIKEIRERFSPQRILVEATGIADPVDVLAVLRPLEERSQIRISKVICVLDSEFWEAREMLGPVFFKQIDLADLLLLNKVDLLGQDQVSLFLSQLHAEYTRPQIVPTVYSRIDPLVLFSNEGSRDGCVPVSEDLDQMHRPSAEEMGFVSFSYEGESCFSEKCFEEFLKNLPFELFRVKGSVRFPKASRLLNFVGGKIYWEQRKEKTPTRLVFIGWNLNPEGYLRQLEACIQE